MDPVDLIAAAKSDSLMDVDSVDASWLLDMVKNIRTADAHARGECKGRNSSRGTAGFKNARYGDDLVLVL